MYVMPIIAILISCLFLKFSLYLDRLLASRAMPSAAMRTQQAHTLPPLPYAYDALAPVINKDIMELHHKKHHQTYVNNLNAAQEKLTEVSEKGREDLGIKTQVCSN